MVEAAYIFPGQGAQYVGMGKDLYESSSPARRVFQIANEVLGFDITKLCFEGPQTQLNQTINCQPAILTFSIACLRALEDQAAELLPKAAAGLSLGEYSALVAAGSLGFEDALRLVSRRAQFMEEASHNNPGKMAAILGLSKDEVQELCQATGIQVANLNCPGQVVISGKLEGVDKAIELAKKKGAKKAVGLDVSGPFHSSLMNLVAEKLSQELKEIEVSAPNIQVVANVTGRYEDSAAEIKENLINQVNHCVKWEDSIRLMSEDNITSFLEIGPGKVLKGLLRRIDPGLMVHNIEDTQGLLEFLKIMQGGRTSSCY